MKNVSKDRTSSNDEKGGKRPRRPPLNTFRKRAYPLSILSIIALFIAIALSGVTSGWLWFFGVIVAIASYIIIGNWWLDLKRMRQKPKSIWTPWLNWTIFSIVLSLAVIGTTVIVPIIRISNSQSSTSVIPRSSTETTPIEHISPDITGRDWVKMTDSQKRAWVQIALDAMVMGETLSRSEIKPIEYYISNIDMVYSNTSNLDESVAWILTEFTSQ